ncbi:MAG: glycosyltransferase [Coriobacteriia bacterium]|nr:glycosyltransferase [Coriobacteriia bacterium]
MPRRRDSSRRVLVTHSSYGGPSQAIAEALAAGLKSGAGDVRVDTLDFLDREMPNLGVLARFAYQQTPEFFPGFAGSLADAPQDGALIEETRRRGIPAAALQWAQTGARAVVSTCPIATAAFAESRPSVDALVAAVISDYSAHHLILHPKVDLLFVPTGEARDDLVVRGFPYDRIVVAGTPVHDRVIGRASRAACATELGFADRFTVAVAGTGILNASRDVVSELAASGIQVAALAAGEPRVRRRLDAAAAETGSVAVVSETRRYGSALSAADALVAPAGSPRVGEALACGLPIVLYNPLPARELFNADFLVNWGAVLLARDEDDVVEKCRYLASHPPRLAQVAAAAAALGRPGATRAICDRVLAAL